MLPILPILVKFGQKMQTVLVKTYAYFCATNWLHVYRTENCFQMKVHHVLWNGLKSRRVFETIEEMVLRCTIFLTRRQIQFIFITVCSDVIVQTCGTAQIKKGGTEVVHNNVIRRVSSTLDVVLSHFMAQRWPNLFGAIQKRPSPVTIYELNI